MVSKVAVAARVGIALVAASPALTAERRLVPMPLELAVPSDLAIDAARAAIAACRISGYRVSVAVVSAHGLLETYIVGDGAQLGSDAFLPRIAGLVATNGLPVPELAARARVDPEFAKRLSPYPAAVTVNGGAPVFARGQVYGAIAVSGAPAAAAQRCAEAGVAAIGPSVG